MPLDSQTARDIAKLANADRRAQARAKELRLELLAALHAARPNATVRELGDATGLSFQRIHQLLGKDLP